MKKAFTMVELIFVIVILGILSGIAMPKIFATRQDAEITSDIANFNTILHDLSNYYAQYGELSNKLSDMTKVPLAPQNDHLDGGGFGASFLVGGKECFYLEFKHKNAKNRMIVWIEDALEAKEGRSKTCQAVARSKAVLSHLKPYEEENDDKQAFGYTFDYTLGETDAGSEEEL